jgi:hypothetical protein
VEGDDDGHREAAEAVECRDVGKPAHVVTPLHRGDRTQAPERGTGT